MTMFHSWQQAALWLLVLLLPEWFTASVVSERAWKLPAWLGLLGASSYAIYLSHVPVISLVQRVVLKWPGTEAAPVLASALFLVLSGSSSSHCCRAKANRSTQILDDWQASVAGYDRQAFGMLTFVRRGLPTT